MMIYTLRNYFAHYVDHFTDFELAYFIGYERIPMDQLCENSTLWKLRSWGKYENYLDAAEVIFGENDDCNVFTEEFYKQDMVDQLDQAKEMLQRAEYPILVTENCEIWVKRTDWN